MLNETLTFPDAEGKQIFVYHWRPQGTSPPKAVVQIAHGMAEHAGRYGRFARALVGAGYEVYAHDHPGHGRTAGALDRIGITDRNCFVQMTEVMGQLTDLIRGRHTGTPLLLFGHSMGSFYI